MQKLSLKDIAAAIGCQTTLTDSVTEISTDSRNIPSGCLFIAIVGEKFDGHDFVQVALNAGAVCAVVMHPLENPSSRIMQVQDTRKALLQIAALYRKNTGVKVVAVTGSVGKTTTKEMVASVMQSSFETHKNEANLNNEIGLAKTILQLEKQHQVAVLEMGMDRSGQIAPLSICAQPNIAIITNIGSSHMEYLGNKENILKEKLDITCGMAKGAPLIVCGDDPMLSNISPKNIQIVMFGINNTKCSVNGQNLQEFSTYTTFEIVYNKVRFDAQIPCMGRHNVYNALAAFAAGVCAGIDPAVAALALKSYTPAGMRQNIVMHSGFTVVEDCYNASPDSMTAALKTLGDMRCDGKRIAVLSDMLELGELATSSHFDAGVWAGQCGVDTLLCTGELAKGYVSGTKTTTVKNAKHFDTQDELFTELKSLLQAGDVVWLKASRGMKLEKIIHRIYKEC